jgi:hypothetical protein
MKSVHLLVRPLNTVTNLRIDVWVAYGRDPVCFGLDGRDNWSSAFERAPEISGTYFNLDLQSRVQTLSARMSLILNRIKLPAGVDIDNLSWSSAPATIWLVDRNNWSTREQLFDGLSSGQIDQKRRYINIDAEGSADFLDVELLTQAFSGGGGLGGEPEVRDKLKPSGFGVCENLVPVFYDNTRNMAMLDGYGNLVSIQWVAEGLNRYTSFAGNYASASLLAAALDSETVKPGQWASSIVDGVIGFGAPPEGIVTCAATFGSTLTGAVLKRMMQVNCSIPTGRINIASFDALDVAMPYPIHFWTDSQENMKQLVERIAPAMIATPVIDQQNRIALSQPFGGALIATLDKSANSVPRVTGHRQSQNWTPTARSVVRTSRPSVVLRRDQINFADDFRPKGVFQTTESYRLGDTVFGPDDAEWLFISLTPALGSAAPLPVWPTASNANWENLKPPPDPSQIRYSTGATLESLRPLEPGATNDQNLDDPNVLTINEKQSERIDKEQTREARYQTLLTRGTALGITTSLTAATTARANWTAHRDAIIGWNNVTVHSAIVRSTWRTLDQAYDNALDTLARVISEEDARRAEWGTTITGTLRPEDSGTRSDNLIRNGDLTQLTEFWTIAGGSVRTAGVAGVAKEPAFYWRFPNVSSSVRPNSGAQFAVQGGGRLFTSFVGRIDSAGTGLISVQFLEYDNAGTLYGGSATINFTPAAAATWEEKVIAITLQPTTAKVLILVGAGGGIGTYADFGNFRVAYTERDANVPVQVSIVGGQDKTIAADYLGAVTGTFPTFAPSVLRNGVSIKTDNTTTYSVTKISNGAAGSDGGTITLDNTNGSATKGNVTTVSFDTGSSQIKWQLETKINGVSTDKTVCTLMKAPANPPAGGGASGGGGGASSGSLPANATITSNVTYASLSTSAAQKVTLTAGQSIRVTLVTGVGTAYSAGTGSGSRYLIAKARYANNSGMTSPTDFGSPVNGTSAYPGAAVGGEWLDPVEGSIEFSQTVATPGAGDWWCDMQGISSAASKSIFMGGATILIEVF